VKPRLDFSVVLKSRDERTVENTVLRKKGLFDLLKSFITWVKIFRMSYTMLELCFLKRRA